MLFGVMAQTTETAAHATDWLLIAVTAVCAVATGWLAAVTLKDMQKEEHRHAEMDMTEMARIVHMVIEEEHKNVD